jgi:transcriptional regulator with XRE-family HTH domain
MNRLKELRQNKGLSQFDLGRTVGIYPQKISDFETGKRDLRLGEAVNIAKVLNVPIDELVKNEGGLTSAGYEGSGIEQ